MNNQDQTKTEGGGAVASSDLLGHSETWFSYDPGDGFETHDTESAARERAEKALDYYKDDAPSDGWSEEVTQVCWGKVSQQVQETMRKRRPPAAELDESGCDKDGTPWAEWDEIVDYALCPNVDIRDAAK
jgi:hypothetical protein